VSMDIQVIQAAIKNKAPTVELLARQVNKLLECRRCSRPTTKLMKM